MSGNSLKRTWPIALLAALLPCTVGAAGLGKLTVLSALGQPLVAEIELISVGTEELSSLSARLAPPDAYRAVNLQHSPALSGARMTLEQRPNGLTYLRIVSPRAVSEPTIDLLVELVWTSGRTSRAYSVLIDPQRDPRPPPRR